MSKAPEYVIPVMLCAVLYHHPFTHSVEADFTPATQANPQSRQQKLVRFQSNPEPFWGPKARAKRWVVMWCDVMTSAYWHCSQHHEAGADDEAGGTETAKRAPVPPPE